MDNLLLPAIVGVLLIVLVVFIIWRNRLDRKNLENKLNQDYKKPQRHEDDADNVLNKTD